MFYNNINPNFPIFVDNPNKIKLGLSLSKTSLKPINQY